MTRTPAEVTAAAIVQLELGTLSGAWPVNVSREPAGVPVEVITTYDTGGRDPLHLEEGLRRPTVQVRVRSAQYGAGWSKVNEIYQTLGTQFSQTFGQDRIVGFSCRGDVFYVGRDSNDNCLFTINFELTRDTSS